jgi:hypothetical protein
MAPGSVISFFGCEHIPLVSDLTVCVDGFSVLNRIKNLNIVNIESITVLGIVEYNGEDIPFETPPIRELFIWPKEENHITIYQTLKGNFINVKLLLRVYILVSHDGEPMVDVSIDKMECID